MTETQAHGREVFGVQSFQQRSDLASNPAEQINGIGIGDDVDSELFVYGPN